MFVFFVTHTATTEIYTYGHTLSLHDALPISDIGDACLDDAGHHQVDADTVGIGFHDGADLRVADQGGLDPPQVVLENRRIDFDPGVRSEEHTSELQSLMRISYAVFCLKKKKLQRITHTTISANNNTNK